MKLMKIAAMLAAVVMLAVPSHAAEPAPPAKPGHVFIIVLENQGYHVTFGPASPATYLKGLAGQGALLSNYYGIGHFSLDNYLAMISGQGVNPATQSDCGSFIEFNQTGTAADGQAVGAGCVYPATVKTIADQLADKGVPWKAILEEMGNTQPAEG